MDPLVACFVVDGRRKTEDGRGFFGTGEVEKEEKKRRKKGRETKKGVCKRRKRETGNTEIQKKKSHV